MQIQLKQAEIVSGIKMFLAAQGIVLNAKQVDVTFATTRQPAGVVADIAIEEVGALPDLGPVDDEAKVGTAIPAAEAATASVTVDDTAVGSIPEKAAAVAEEPAAEAVAAAPAAKSLFG